MALGTRVVRLIGLVAGTLMMGSPMAHASRCLRGPAQLPGFSQGPEWRDFDGDGFWRPELHDPRWGSSRPQVLTRSPGLASPLLESAASVQALVFRDVLYVAVYVEDDSDGPTLADSFHFGFTEGTSNSAHVFKVALACDTLPPGGAPNVPPGSPLPEAPADPDPPRQLDGSVVTHWFSTDARVTAPTWTREPTSSTPSWAPWLSGACWDRVTTSSPRWAVTLRVAIPHTDDQDRDMFFGVSTSAGGSPPVFTVVGNVPPAAGADAVGGTLVPQSINSWEHFTTDLSNADSPCLNDLTVDESDVGVWLGEAGNPSGGALVDRICTGSDCAGDTVFRVTGNGATRRYPQWGVRARFRVVDWGSSADTREYGTWRDVWELSDGSQPNPLGVDASILGKDARWHTHATSNGFIIDFACQREDDAHCHTLTSGTHNQPTFLVELGRRDTAQPPKIWARALRNMRFKDLPLANEEAAISVAGLEEVFDDKDAREVYLQVVARNLLAHDGKPQWLNSNAMQFAKSSAEQSLTTNQYIPGSSKSPAAAKPKPSVPGRRREHEEFLETRARLAAGHAKSVAMLALDNTPLVRGLEKHEVLAMTDTQLMDAVWPTYRVRAYYAHEREAGAEGGERIRLVPMPSFGLRLTHDGPLYGFSYTLKDETNKVLAPLNGTSNWYKLTIPNEGRRNVRLEIVAEAEPKLTPDPPSLSPISPVPSPGTKAGSIRCTLAPPGPSKAAAAAMTLFGALLGWRWRRRRDNQPSQMRAQRQEV